VIIADGSLTGYGGGDVSLTVEPKTPEYVPPNRLVGVNSLVCVTSTVPGFASSFSEALSLLLSLIFEWRWRCFLILPV